MNLSETFNRCKLGLASATLALGLVSGSAQADIDSGDLFFIAIDSSRDGAQVSYALDLNLNALTQSPNLESSTTDAGLQAWLNAPNASSLIQWGVFAAGNTGSAAAVRIFSTVNPADEAPNLLSQGDIIGSITNADSYISSFNSVDVNDAVEASQGQAGFPQGFGDSWGGITSGNFSSMGDIDDALNMWVFAIEQSGSFSGLPPEQLTTGFWTLDAASGTVAFSAVPVPAAVWMFGSALIGLFGARRRAA